MPQAETLKTDSAFKHNNVDDDNNNVTCELHQSEIVKLSVARQSSYSHQYSHFLEYSTSSAIKTPDTLFCLEQTGWIRNFTLQF